MLRPTRLLLPLLVLAVGCDPASDYLAVFREQRAALDATADVLAGIRGETDLTAAKAALEDGMERLDAVARRSRDMKQPTPQVMERLEAERATMERATARFQAELRRVRALPGGAAFLNQIEANHHGL